MLFSGEGKKALKEITTTLSGIEDFIVKDLPDCCLTCTYKNYYIDEDEEDDDELEENEDESSSATSCMFVVEQLHNKDKTAFITNLQNELITFFNKREIAIAFITKKRNSKHYLFTLYKGTKEEVEQRIKEEEKEDDDNFKRPKKNKRSIEADIYLYDLPAKVNNFTICKCFKRDIKYTDKYVPCVVCNNRASTRTLTITIERDNEDVNDERVFDVCQVTCCLNNIAQEYTNCDNVTMSINKKETD